jgi:general secretion pathway protein D
MKSERRGILLTVLAAFLIALLPACKASKKKEEAAPKEEQVAGTPDAEKALDTAEMDQKAKTEFEAVMYGQHMEMAREYRNALELDRALGEVDNALGYRPSSDDALKLRAEIMRLLGDRAGETRTVIDDQYEASEVKREEQKVTVRRLIAEGKQAMEAKSYEQSDESYERALFIVSSAKLSPLGMDDDLSTLGSEAEAGKKELERRMAQADAEQERRDTQRALKQVAEAEEKQLLEGRERRARMLSAAIDAFNREDFELAENYAQQVLREEPDNTVAHDLLENARRAQHTVLGEQYLRDLKDSFRRWQVDIEQTKIPSTKILSWPSQTFWDRISQLRAMRDVGGGGREMTPEEQAVANTLNTRTITLPFEGTAFPQVVDYLSASCGVNFVIDPRAREELDAAEVTLQADSVTVKDGIDLILLQVSAEGAIVYEISGNVVRFLKKENIKKDMALRIHPVADLTLGLTDFIPPQITLVGVDEDSEAPLFGGQAEEAPQPYGTIEELMELVRTSVTPAAWEEGGTISAQGKNLVVYAPPEVQNQVAQFLDDLRSFAGIVITIESRFLTVSDNFLRDLGVDVRGTGGANSGPLAVLDDVTNGLVNNASAGFDNSGPGVAGGGAALSPSSGIFFNDGGDGDFRGRSENLFINPLGQVLSALGGGTFALTYLDDIAVSVVIRATEKTTRARELTAPSLTVYNTQRANITVVNQISFIEDFDVEVAQTAFIADPVIGVIQDGLTLDVRPTVSNDRQFITLELRPTIADLVTPIQTFQTLLGAAIAIIAAQNPVTIQLPELNLKVAESTVRIPDRGSVLLGGLKDINISDQKSSSPILGNIPILSFLFSRQGKSEEIEHLMIIVTATITDLQEAAQNVRG